MGSILDEELADFMSACNSILGQFFSVLSLYNEKSIDGFSSDIMNLVVESLFLKACGYWESFIEKIFIYYMLGNKSEKGDSIKLYVSPRDYTHAYNLIKNVSIYPDWTDTAKILINAENFFENGGPFCLLKTLKGQLSHIKTIRNAIAHTSLKATQDFDDLVRGLIGHLPDNINPSIFLSEYKNGKKKTSPTYFEYYLRFLTDSAIMLVEYKPENNKLE